MGDSWKWQLRDRLGQWMDMDSEVRWLSSGESRQGHIVGSPKPGVATVEENGSLNVARRVNVPTSRLTAITLPPGKVRPPAKPRTLPMTPKNWSNLSDRQVERLYWAMRDHPDVPTHRWLRAAWEMQKRKIKIDPHMGGGMLTPEGMFAAGTPAAALSPTSRMMQIKIIEHELSLRVKS